MDLGRGYGAETGIGEPDGTEFNAGEIASGVERGDDDEAFALDTGELT